jgi:hypothetical protein
MKVNISNMSSSSDNGHSMKDSSNSNNNNTSSSDNTMTTIISSNSSIDDDDVAVDDGNAVGGEVAVGGKAQDVQDVNVHEDVYSASDIPDSKYWKRLRKAYFKAKGQTDVNWDGWVRDYLNESGSSGCMVDVRDSIEIRRGRHGRGLFATCLIPAGTHIWDTELVGRFLNRDQFESFLSLLSPKMQYDVLEWVYLEDERDGYGMLVYLDLDPATLMNHGYTPEQGDAVEGGETKQVGLLEAGWTDCQPATVHEVEVDVEDDSDDSDDDDTTNATDKVSSKEVHIVASRDLQPGDELLIDYTSFHDYKNESDHYFDIVYENVVEKQRYYSPTTR